MIVTTWVPWPPLRRSRRRWSCRASGSACWSAPWGRGCSRAGGRHRSGQSSCRTFGKRGHPAVFGWGSTVTPCPGNHRPRNSRARLLTSGWGRDPQTGQMSSWARRSETLGHPNTRWEYLTLVCKFKVTSTNIVFFIFICSSCNQAAVSWFSNWLIWLPESELI